MWGAVVGDIAGSRFEGSRGPKDFELLHRRCTHTDATLAEATEGSSANGLEVPSPSLTEASGRRANVTAIRVWEKHLPRARNSMGGA